MDELEIMREQLTMMKKQLDTQQIINNELMRKVMKGKASWLNKFVNIEIITLPLVYLLFVGICAWYGISQWFAFTFLILGAIDTAFDWKLVRIPKSLFGEATMVELKRFLIKQKKARFIQTCVALPLALIWIVMLFWAMANNSNISMTDDFIQATKIGGLCGGIIGGVIGLIVVINIYRKIQRTNDDILSDIETID